MTANRDDPEIRAFVAASQAVTFTEMARALAERFGPDRAWRAELVAEVSHELFPAGRARLSRFERDVQVMDFIADRAGLLAIDAILNEGNERFGRPHFPSRSRLNHLLRQIVRQGGRTAVRRT